MASSSCHFFQKGNSAQFEFLLNIYPQVLKVKAENRAGKKPEKLIRLDDWYNNTLPKLIQKRGKDAHLVHEELVQLMEWKQTRGKSYPQLTHLIKINTPRAVMMETKKAFRKLPNLEQALNALSNLKGVGTTMASALLAAACPETAPFMADECLMAIPEFESIDYTVKEYLKFVTHIQTAVDRLNKEVHGPEPENNGSEENGTPQEPPKPKTWTAHKVELALWAHYVASDLQPELLKGMPESNGVANSGSAVTVSVANGSAAVVPDLDNEDDSSQNGVPPSDESNMDSESASKDASSVVTNGTATALMNTDSMDGSENGNPATADDAESATIGEETTATAATSINDLPADSLDDCTKSGDSLDGAPEAVEATAAAVATLCTADGEDSQSSNSQKRPLYCDENSEEQPELSAPKLIKL